MLNFLFASYEWYRRWKGGNWYLVRTRVLQGAFWIWRQSPKIHELTEYICKAEQWE